MPIDIANSAAAANAYANTAKGISAPGIEAPKGQSFTDYIKQAAVESVETMHAGEKASADAVIGKASLTDVVEAVTAAELTLQTVVALRDRMLQSYQDIMRMQI